MAGGGPLYPIGLAVSALLSISFAVVTWRNRREDGATSYTAVSTSFAVWCVSMALLLLEAGPPQFLPVWLGIALATSGVTASSWFVFSLVYTGYEHWLRTEVKTALLGLLATLFFVVVTNPIHDQLYWVQAAKSSSGAVQYGFGVLFWIGVVPFISITVFGTGLCLLQAKRSRNIYRKVNFVNGVGGCAQTLVILLDVTGVTPTPLFVDGPLLMGFLASIGLLTFQTTLVYRLLPLDRLLSRLRPGSESLVPLGRDYIIENIDDGLVVLSDEGRIVDLNDTAKELLGKTTLGNRITELEAFDALLPADGDVMALDRTTDRFWPEDGNSQRCFDLTLSELATTSEGTAGYVLLMRDVTAVREREEELGLLKDTMSRFLRHNIRNEMNLARSKVELIADEDYDTVDTEQTVEEILAVMDKIVQRSDKARYVERIVEDTGDRVTVDLTRVLEGLQHRFQAQCPDATVSVDVEAGTEVLALSHIDRAFENLIENAIEHNSGPARVGIRSRVEDDHVEILVEDDGPGIDEYEIDVLRQGRETDLQHGSGFGLWLVRWIVDRSGGSLSFEVTDHGTVVSVTLDRAPVTAEDADHGERSELHSEAIASDSGTGLDS